MGIDLKKYAKLKQHADDNQRAVDKLAGVIEGLEAELQRKYGIHQAKAVKAKLKQLTQERDEAEREYEKALGVFLETYPDIEGEGGRS